MVRDRIPFALITHRRDIQVEASILVQEAERAIAKANPANPGGKGTPKNSVLQDDAVVKPTTLRNIRQAHDSVDDEEFQEIIEQAKDEAQPLTRQALVEVGRRKRREEMREISMTKKITSLSGITKCVFRFC